MRQEYRLGFRSDSLSQCFSINIVGSDIDIYENWNHAVLDDRVERRGETRSDRDYFVSSLQGAIAEQGRHQRGEGHEVSRGAGVDEKGILGAGKLAKELLELLRIPTAC